MKIEGMHPSLLEALRERGHSDTAIEVMSGYGVFKEFCEWHGLIGWAPWLWEISDDCRKNGS